METHGKQVDARRLSLPVWLILGGLGGGLVAGFVAGEQFGGTADALRAMDASILLRPTSAEVKVMVVDAIRPLESSVAEMRAEMRALSSRVERSETLPGQDR